MLETLLLNQQIQVAIALIIASLLGLLIKRKVDHTKLAPIISLIIGLIFKVEPGEKEKPIDGLFKKATVLQELHYKLDDNSKSWINKKFGNMANAVQWVFDKYGQPALKKGFHKLIK